MPKVETVVRNRHVELKLVPGKRRLKMLRNQIQFIMSLGDGEDNQSFMGLRDNLHGGANSHSLGLFSISMEDRYRYTSDGSREPVYEITMFFERLEDLERVQKNFVMPLKLSNP